MGDVILTTDHVSAWTKERADLAARITLLDAKLAAAHVLMADGVVPVATASVVAPTPHVRTKTHQTKGDDGNSTSLVDAIVEVLKRFADKPMSNQAILKRLKNVGYNTSQMHKNYYYTATKRLSDKGIIIKNGAGLYSLPENGLPAGDPEAKAGKAARLPSLLNPNPAQPSA